MAASTLGKDTNFFFRKFNSMDRQARNGAFAHPTLKVILSETFKLLPAPNVFSIQILLKLMSTFPTTLLAFAGMIICHILDCYTEMGVYNSKLKLDNKYERWFNAYTTLGRLQPL